MKKFYIFLVTLVAVNETMAQWVPQNSGTTNTLSSVYFTDVNTGYAVGESGTILKTADGGTIWDTLSSGTTASLASVHFPHADTGYAVGVDWGGTILKTIDAGTNWTKIYDPFPLSCHSVFFTDANTGYVSLQGVPYTCSIIKTTDGGISWNNSIEGSTLSSYPCIYFPTSDTGYAVYAKSTSPYGNIIKTVNAGLTWETIFSSTSKKIRSVYFIDSDKGFAVGEDGVIIKTTDGGSTWIDMISGTTNALNSIYFTYANTGYAVGDWGTILKTSDGGITWENQTSGNSIYLTSVFFTNADTGYVVGGGGTILKTTNGGLVGLNESGIMPKFLKIYPNPAKDKITIESFMTGDTPLSILNVNSQKIMERQISDYKTQIDISNLSPGVYFVKLQNRNTVEIKKLIKQ